MKSRFANIEFPVFCHYTVHVEVSSDLGKSMKKYPQTKNIPDADDFNRNESCAVHLNDEPFSFIFLPYNASVGTVAHESWHVIQRMMKYMGVDVENEVVAYHLGYLSRQGL